MLYGRTLHIALLGIALTGCSDYLDCDVDYLLPGMWTGDVTIENGTADTSIDADLHIQLFPDGDGVTGWAYFTEGHFRVGAWQPYPCQPFALSGDLTAVENGIEIDCLLPDGSDTCIEFEGDETGASFEVSWLFWSEGAALPHYEGIGDRLLEEFQCLL
jgi:hypothetical protein